MSHHQGRNFNIDGKNHRRTRTLEAVGPGGDATGLDPVRRQRLDRLRRRLNRGDYRLDPARLAATLIRRG